MDAGNSQSSQSFTLAKADQTILEDIPKNRWYIPQLLSGVFWKDVYFMSVVLFLQIGFIPRIFPFLSTEVATLFLAIYLVYSPPLEALFLTLLSAFLLETHYAVPAYFYFFTYGIAAVILLGIRELISWRNVNPWLVLLTSLYIWIQGNEITILAITLSDWTSSDLYRYGLFYFIRLFFLLVMGYGLFQIGLIHREDHG